MGVEEAAKALTPALSKEVNWFAEPGQKHFIDPVSLGVIATGLIKVFITAAVTAAGTETGKLIVGYVRDLIAGHAKTDPKAVAAEAASARAELAKLPPEQALARLTAAQAELAAQFAEVMPRARAEGLAASVQGAARPLLQ